MGQVQFILLFKFSFDFSHRGTVQTMDTYYSSRLAGFLFSLFFVYMADCGFVVGELSG